MKNDKACGNDKIVKEMIEACEDFGVDKICEIANCIFNTGRKNTKSNETINLYDSSQKR